MNLQDEKGVSIFVWFHCQSEVIVNPLLFIIFNTLNMFLKCCMLIGANNWLKIKHAETSVNMPITISTHIHQFSNSNSISVFSQICTHISVLGSVASYLSTWSVNYRKIKFGMIYLSQSRVGFLPSTLYSSGLLQTDIF